MTFEIFFWCRRRSSVGIVGIAARPSDDAQPPPPQRRGKGGGVGKQRQRGRRAGAEGEGGGGQGREMVDEGEFVGVWDGDSLVDMTQAGSGGRRGGGQGRGENRMAVGGSVPLGRRCTHSQKSSSSTQ